MIRTKIKVLVKTFHGNRKTYEFQVSISEKVGNLRDLLAQREPEEMSSYHVIRLVYPMGVLKNLNLD